MKQSFQRSRNSGAFSLIEVSVALGIFAFAIVAILGLMGASLKSTRDSEERIQAANLATRMMGRYEELLKEAKKAGGTPNWGNMPMQSISNDFSSVTLIDNEGNVASDDKEAAFGMRYISKQEPIAGSNSDFVHCTIELQWPVVAANNDQAVSKYTTTSGFVVNP